MLEFAKHFHVPLAFTEILETRKISVIFIYKGDSQYTE